MANTTTHAEENTDLPIPAMTRDVTPNSVTPGPIITGPLKRIPGVEIAPAQVRTRRLYRVRILDTRSFEAFYLKRRWHIQLPNILPVTQETLCQTNFNQTWTCGRVALISLQRFIRLKAIECDFAWPETPGIIVAPCRLNGEKLAKLIIQNGWAKPANTADKELKILAREAENNQRGIYYQPTAESQYILNNSTAHNTQKTLPPPPHLSIPDLLGPVRRIEENNLIP